MSDVNTLQAQVAEMQAQLEKLGVKKKEAPDTTERTYFHRVPGSSVVVVKEDEDGGKVAVHFIFDREGKLVTSDPDVNAFMKGAMRQQGCPITLAEPKLKKDPLQLQAEQEVIGIAQRSIDKLGAEAGKASK